MVFQFPDSEPKIGIILELILILDSESNINFLDHLSGPVKGCEWVS